VVALGIGGSEERARPSASRRSLPLASARVAIVAHAGESTGPESVWAALNLGAERIGHGIAAARDAELVRHLRERGHPLEICLTSNLVTGVVKSLDEHPLRRLYDAGVPIIIEHGRPGHVRLHADGRISPGGAAVRVQRSGDAGDCGERFRYAFQ